MNYIPLTENNMKSVIPLYIEYYNRCEDAEWTEEKANKRIHQIVTIEDSYGLILEDNGETIGFVMGYFSQYDDGIVYDLNEIVIDRAFQGRGMGTVLLNELQKRVKERGAFLMQLTSVNDEMHHHFYAKNGLKDCSNLLVKSKII